MSLAGPVMPEPDRSPVTAPLRFVAGVQLNSTPPPGNVPRKPNGLSRESSPSLSLTMSAWVVPGAARLRPRSRWHVGPPGASTARCPWAGWLGRGPRTHWLQRSRFRSDRDERRIPALPAAAHMRSKDAKRRGVSRALRPSRKPVPVATKVRPPRATASGRNGGITVRCVHWVDPMEGPRLMQQAHGFDTHSRMERR